LFMVNGGGVFLLFGDLLLRKIFPGVKILKSWFKKGFLEERAFSWF